MKRIRLNTFIFFLVMQCFAVSLFAQTASTLKEAESAYMKKDYRRSIELYEKLLKSKGASAEVYYNLGNAYYKAGDVAPSILYYERAHLMDPGDGDIRFNLQMARQKAVDNIVPVGDFFLVSWFKNIENLYSADSWAQIGIVSFILLLGALILFFFSKWIRLKKIGFYIGLVFLIVVVFANVFANGQRQKLIDRTGAIVFSSTVTVKSSPDESGTDLFILHEGTKVNIKSKLGTWREISTEDGNVGWMPANDIKVI